MLAEDSDPLASYLDAAYLDADAQFGASGNSLLPAASNSLAVAPPAAGTGFVTEENVEQGRTYINKCLAEAGFPAPLVLWQPAVQDVVKTVNCIFLLIQQRQKDVNVRAFRIDYVGAS